jgi:hypothetical protein
MSINRAKRRPTSGGQGLSNSPARTASTIVNSLLVSTNICETDCDISSEIDAAIDAAIDAKLNP